MPKVSIITPVYNSELFLPKCIQSIIDQLYRDWELLLIDDGSNDKSSEICDEYAAKDNRIRVFHKKNGGASSARNLGLDNAKGEWVTFIDSDDTIEQNYFNPLEIKEAELLVLRWKHPGQEDTSVPFQEGIYKDKDYIKFMEAYAHKPVFRMVAVKFLKRDIIEKYHIRFNTKMKLGEDTLFMQKYYSHINSLAINNSSYYLYYRPENWGGTKYIISHEEFKCFFREFDKTNKILPYHNKYIFPYLYDFFSKKIENKNSIRSKLFIKTVPEYVEYRKQNLNKSSSSSIIKWIIIRFLSLFNEFL